MLKPPPPKKRKLESMQRCNGSSEPPPSCFGPQGKSNQSLHLPIQQKSTVGGTQRRVRFSETSHATALPPRESLELDRRWYTRSDIARFKRGTKAFATSLSPTRTARLMKHVAFLASCAAAPTACPLSMTNWEVNLRGRIDAVRGVEHLLCPEVTRLLLLHKKMVVRLVLEEQWKGRILDDLNGTIRNDNDRAASIARVSTLASSFSREWARRILCLHQEATSCEIVIV